MAFRVANVISRFNSASGGPPRTVAMIAQAAFGLWRPELFTTDYVAPHHDSLLTQDFAGHVNMLPASAQTALGGTLMAFGIFRGYEAQLLRGVAPDVIHLHGIWTPYMAAYAASALRNRIPYIVAPHGMLEPWATAIRHRRKKLALDTYQGYILRNAAALHTTSELEAQNIRRFGWLKRPIFVVPNAVDEPADGAPREVSAFQSPSVLLFMSRVHEKKGLDILLQAWNEVRPLNWALKIVGSGEASYVDRLKRYCHTMQVPNVEFYGHVDGDARESMYRQASALVLPTYSENFGNVVAEAMIRGLPVITTTGTPWSVVASQKLGWYIEPSLEPLRRALSELAATPASQLHAMGERGRSFAQAFFSLGAVRKSLLEMYLTVLGRRQDSGEIQPQIALTHAARSS